LENCFKLHVLWDERHEKRLEFYIQLLLEAENNTPTETVASLEAQRIISSLNAGKVLPKIRPSNF